MTPELCAVHCAFYHPDREEAEKCLGAVAATFLGRRRPEWRTRLTSPVPPPGPGPAALAAAGAVLCRACAFRRHGCDFARGEAGAPPCGGLKAMAGLMEQGELSEASLEELFRETLSRAYLRLAEHVSLKRLELPCLYDRLADELYEVNEEAFAFLRRCDGTNPGLAGEAEPEFLEYLLEESLLALAAAPAPRILRWRPAPVPSLRYLELMLTDRCNLRCAHCYLGDAGASDLPLAEARAALTEFTDMQGLRVLLSGGEPLLYPQWRDLNAALPEYEIRAVLLTNGTLLSPKRVRELRVQEVQVSLDGLAEGHDRLRGPGTWKRAVAGLKRVQDRGLAVSVATMVHTGNLHELEEMGQWLKELGVREWSLDVPCVSGRLAEHPDLKVPPELAAPYLDLAFGAAAHGAAPGWTCGRHLCAVLPDGRVAKCGLYAHRPLGHLREGLEVCWRRLRHPPISELECAACEHVADCRGGCRFRAGEGLGPDPIMCARFGVNPARFGRRNEKNF
ncbi:MAG: radical SAM protein [Syntrophobacterales bacterium]|nr:radical SAM protein [Syntrophobacterales bacterium]